MCYLSPGPRCSASAVQKMKEALESKDALLIAKARQEYMLTPAGIQELKDKGRYEVAEVMEQKRNELIAESKELNAPKVSNKRLAAADEQTYFEPNESEKEAISGAFTTGGDAAFIENDPQGQFSKVLYNSGSYSPNTTGQAHLDSVDYKAKYDSDVSNARMMALSGNQDAAKAVMDSWNQTKNRTHAQSLAASAQVSPVETEAVLNEWDGQTSSTRLIQEAVGAFGGQQTYDPRNPTHRVLAAQYHRTQAYLSNSGIDTVRVYRSAGPQSVLLESCTLDEDIAKAQGGPVYFYDMPANQIVSLPQTGMGSLATHEVVVHAPHVQWQGGEEVMSNPDGVLSGFHQ